MLVDTGYFMADQRSAHEFLRPAARAKNDWVLRGYEETNVDVLNVSSHDLRYFSSVLSKPEFTRRAQAEPLLDHLVSANTVSESPSVVAPRPYIIREIASREARSKPLRVAFIGLTETTPAPPPGFKFIDPAEAAKRAAREAKKASDVVVALAKVSSEEAARIARAAPDIDVIIAGNAASLEQSFTPPFYAGQTLIVFTPFETRMLGELRFYRGAEGKFTTRQRFVVLDELAVPEDAEAKKIVDAAAAAETQARNNAKQLLDEWLASSLRRGVAKPGFVEGKAVYVTSASCSQCHLAQYMKWANSAHAQAASSFASPSVEFELSCIECHATGAGTPVANGKPEFAGIQSVQCEECHGPGSNHAAKPEKGYGRISDIKSVCVKCHTPQIKSSFDVQAAWEKIKH